MSNACLQCKSSYRRYSLVLPDARETVWPFLKWWPIGSSNNTPWRKIPSETQTWAVVAIFRGTRNTSIALTIEVAVYGAPVHMALKLVADVVEAIYVCTSKFLKLQVAPTTNWSTHWTLYPNTVKVLNTDCQVETMDIYIKTKVYFCCKLKKDSVNLKETGGTSLKRKGKLKVLAC